MQRFIGRKYILTRPKEGLKIRMPTDALLVFTSKFIDKVYPSRQETMWGTAKEKGCAILVFNSKIAKLGKPEFKFIVGAASSCNIRNHTGFPFRFRKSA